MSLETEIQTYTEPTTECLNQVIFMYNDYFKLSPWSEKYLNKFFSKKEQIPVLCVLEHKEILQGFAIGKICTEGDEFLVHSFLISENLRGKGLSKKLMQSMLDFVVKNTNIKNLTVRFRSSNSAKYFYESFGFSNPQMCGIYSNGEQKISMMIAI